MPGTGKDGRVTKGDMLAAIEHPPLPRPWRSPGRGAASDAPSPAETLRAKSG